MVKKELQIVWTDQAKLALRNLYNFHKEVSVEWADKILAKVYQSPETIRYANQFQLDEYNTSYRRIVVGDYKVLYQQNNDTIYVMDIVCSLQYPKSEI